MIPIQVGTDSNWKEVSTGYHTLALKHDGTIWAWGNNSSSELGDNTTINKDIPTQIGSDTDWLHIFATTYSSYAIKIMVLYGLGGIIRIMKWEMVIQQI